MRLVLLVGCLGFLFTPLKAQVRDYSFGYETGTFASLAGQKSQNLYSHKFSDDRVYQEKRQLPFPFIFNGVSFDSLGISENGYIWFGPASSENGQVGGVGAISTPYFSGVEGIISAYGQDLHPHVDSTSPSYIYSGSFGMAPARVFVVEWNNTGRYENVSLAAPEDSITFQILLYELSNKIEIRYGYVGLNPDVISLAELGVRGDYTDFHNRQTIGSNWEATSRGDDQASYCEFSIKNCPQEGEIFSFLPDLETFASAHKQVLNRPSVRVVNPVTGTLQVLGVEEIQPVTICDFAGRELLSGTLQNGTMDISALPAGWYVLRLSEQGGLPFVKP